MHILRLQIPGRFLEAIGVSSMLADIERVEILQAYQYDQQNFFSLQRILFKVGAMENLEKIVKEKFGGYYFQILEKTSDNEIICIMKQKRTQGFWPLLDAGPWAFIFPIYVDSDKILINIIAEEAYVTKLKTTISKFTTDYNIIAQNKIDTMSKFEDVIGRSSIPFPNFTNRQREIAGYAAKRGFFESPKKITADNLADHFKISVSAINELLRKAENIAMSFFFGGKISDL
jgi:predicted DNA binding protein